MGVTLKDQATIPVGAVVAWVAPVTNLTIGLNANAERSERIGRVSHFRSDGSVVVYDPDGIRAVVQPERLIVLADRAEAGWANLA